jgi:PTH1 family peptidyl-tRNA hydrolase
MIRINDQDSEAKSRARDKENGMDDAKARIIVGLGNPGRKYAHTRHNVGFMTLDEFAARRGVPSYKKKTPDFERADYDFDGLTVTTLKPLRFMNLSGEAMAACNINWDSALASAIVVYDDAALALGRLRIRLSGSAGGHNGLRNIISTFGTEQIPRLRVGISRASGESLRDHVLAPFDKDERIELDIVLRRAADALEMCVAEGVRAAMNEFNKSPSQDFLY